MSQGAMSGEAYGPWWWDVIMLAMILVALVVCIGGPVWIIIAFIQEMTV